MHACMYALARPHPSGGDSMPSVDMIDAASPLFVDDALTGMTQAQLFAEKKRRDTEMKKSMTGGICVMSVPCASLL